jgi:hypothetical protein
MLKKWLVISVYSLIPIACFCNPIDLRQYEGKIHSQNGEDGILSKIFELLNVSRGYCVEFGAADGYLFANSLQFREMGWEALLLDGTYDIPEINLHREWITKENIAFLFEKYQVPREFDLLSIDIDSNDWYIWKEAGKYYRPKVVIIEYNPAFGQSEDRIIKYNPQHQWKGDTNYGASFIAYYNLGRHLGYSLVAATHLNAIFVREDLLRDKDLHFKYENDPAFLFLGPLKIHEETKNIPYISSSQGLLE